MRKESSTNSLNEEQIKNDCDISYAFSVLGARWKLNILAYLLEEGNLRFSELKMKLTGISERQLALKLKELGEDGLLQRIVYPEVPPKVEYKLTSKGKGLEKILNLMSEWGRNNKEV